MILPVYTYTKYSSSAKINLPATTLQIKQCIRYTLYSCTIFTFTYFTLFLPWLSNDILFEEIPMLERHIIIFINSYLYVLVFPSFDIFYISKHCIYRHDTSLTTKHLASWYQHFNNHKQVKHWQHKHWKPIHWKGD